MEDCGYTQLFEIGHILIGNNAADDHDNVIHFVLFKKDSSQIMPGLPGVGSGDLLGEFAKLAFSSSPMAFKTENNWSFFAFDTLDLDALTNISNAVSNQQNLVTLFNALVKKLGVLVKVGGEVAKVFSSVSSFLLHDLSGSFF